MDINEAKTKLSEKTVSGSKQTRSKSGIGWEIGAYTIRGVSVIIPASIIMTMENSWIKNGLGFMAMLLIIAVFIIFKEPIKKASGYAPGVIPFSIFVVIAIFFDTTAQSLLAVGLSGLGGSLVAAPLHIKYLTYSSKDDSPELQALKDLAKKLK